MLTANLDSPSPDISGNGPLHLEISNSIQMIYIFNPPGLYDFLPDTAVCTEYQARLDGTFIRR